MKKQLLAKIFTVDFGNTIRNRNKILQLIYPKCYSINSITWFPFPPNFTISEVHKLQQLLKISQKKKKKWVKIIIDFYGNISMMYCEATRC